MKKPEAFSLLIILAIFASFIMGIFLGRFSSRGAQLSSSQSVPKSSCTSQNTNSQIYHNGLLNVNLATKEDLMLLPGIGEVLAGNIISHRQNNGPFISILDLLKVEGLGEGKLENIQAYITLGG